MYKTAFVVVFTHSSGEMPASQVLVGQIAAAQVHNLDPNLRTIQKALEMCLSRTEADGVMGILSSVRDIHSD